MISLLNLKFPVVVYMGVGDALGSRLATGPQSGRGPLLRVLVKAYYRCHLIGGSLATAAKRFYGILKNTKIKMAFILGS